MSALPGSDAAVFAFGPFVLDRDRRLLARGSEPVAITPKAFDLLVVLVERGGVPVTKEELVDRLWPDTAVEESNLTFQISTLRKALGADGARFIATLPGRGYQFVAPLQRIEAAATIEDEERTTITVSESGPPWKWVAALAVLVIGAAVAIALLRRESPPPSPSAGIGSLAVLPFKPLASSQRDEALELGMADTLITRLSRIPDVIVRPMGAVRRYSKLDDDPVAAGKELGVDAVVDGSIQRRGPRVRVTVRLLRTVDGKPVWASQFDDDATDLFAVQDLVAERVARAIVPQPQPAYRLTSNLEAYELYLKGRFLAPTDPASAEELYRQAIARDPRFAAAWAAIADSWLFRGRFGNKSGARQFNLAREAAMKAIALDPENAEAHAALAQVSDYDWDWKRADAEFRRALELNPNSDVAHAQYAMLLLVLGDHDGALEHSRRAVQIDPLSPMWAVGRGQVLASTGRYDAAIAQLEETVRAHPHLAPAYLHLSLAQTAGGNPEAGIVTMQKVLTIHPGSSQLLAIEAYAQARAGHRDKALAIIADIEKRQAPPAHSLALIWTALGDHDRAFEWLERAYQERLYLLRIVVTLPGFAPLRNDPRYKDLVRRMGL